MQSLKKPFPRRIQHLEILLYSTLHLRANQTVTGFFSETNVIYHYRTCIKNSDLDFHTVF